MKFGKGIGGFGGEVGIVPMLRLGSSRADPCNAHPAPRKHEAQKKQRQDGGGDGRRGAAPCALRLVNFRRVDRIGADEDEDAAHAAIPGFVEAFGASVGRPAHCGKRRPVESRRQRDVADASGRRRVAFRLMYEQEDRLVDVGRCELPRAEAGDAKGPLGDAPRRSRREAIRLVSMVQRTVPNGSQIRRRQRSGIRRRFQFQQQRIESRVGSERLIVDRFNPAFDSGLERRRPRAGCGRERKSNRQSGKAGRALIHG